jgi:hypothetical protein
MKQFVLDGMSISAGVPANYPGPLEFFTIQTEEEIVELLPEFTGMPIVEALRHVEGKKHLIALSADRRWIAMVNEKAPDYWSVEVVERQTT